MNKKDMIIVALATFCLTSTLFMILPSRSAERDPWADTSGPIQGQPDGTINMRDINYEIQHFNQDVSNMTRNVTIAGHASKLAYSVEDQIVAAGLDFYTPYISVDGYSKVTVCLYSSTSQMACYVHCQHFNFTGEWFEFDRTNGTYSFSKTYDVPNQQMFIHYANRDVISATIAIDVYLIA